MRKCSPKHSRRSGVWALSGRLIGRLGCVVLGVGQALTGATNVSPGEAAKISPPREAMLILKAECFSCHNEKKKKGGLVLTSREALLKGSDSGPVAEPGNQEGSVMAKVL